MRRTKPLSVKVKAPSRGLVTRWPSETADQLGHQFGAKDQNRAATASENVRYEAAVIANAPGYDSATLVGAFDTAVQNIFQGNTLAVIPKPIVFGTLVKLYSSGLDSSSSARFRATNTQIFTGADASTFPAYRWGAINFGDKMIFAQASINPQLWTVAGSTTNLPGLDTRVAAEAKFQGIESFFNHVLLWRDEILQWSDLNDYTVFIPVASTIASMSLTLTESITQPAYLASTTLKGVLQSTAGLTVGQYVRIADTQSGVLTYNFYLVDAVAPAAGLTAILSGTTTQTIAVSPNVTQLFITRHKLWEAGQRLTAAGSTTILVVDSVSVEQNVVYSLKVDATVASSFTVDLEDTITGFQLDEYVSLGPTFAPSNDIFKITNIEIVADDTRLTLFRMNMGTTPKAPTGVYSAEETFLVRQPWVKLVNSSGSTITPAVNSVLTEKYAVSLTLQQMTGASIPTATIASGKIITTLDANEAGQARIVGADINGPIFQVVTLGEYAHIFKEWSILSVQYVGKLSGTFFIRKEFGGEGLIARNALCKIGDGRVCFVGHKEIYDYKGGPTPTPVCGQVSREFFLDLDQTKLDHITVHHEDQRNEVWISYPSKSSSQHRVLVWNYVEDTATFDKYDLIKLSGTGGVRKILSFGMLDWNTDPSWNSLPDDLTWQGMIDSGDDRTWNDMVTNGIVRYTVMGTGNGKLMVFGGTFAREGEAYTSFSETMDFDLGDDTLWKYVDVVHLGLQIKVPDGVPSDPTFLKRLYIQVGSRPNLDSTITWTVARSISVTADGNPITKVNPGGAGRYLRLRFLSSQTNLHWRISSFEIFTRPGGTY